MFQVETEEQPGNEVHLSGSPQLPPLGQLGGAPLGCLPG